MKLLEASIPVLIIAALFVASLPFLPDRWFPLIEELPDPTPRELTLRVEFAEKDAWAITEEFSECKSCGAPVDPGAKRCRGGCRV